MPNNLIPTDLAEVIALHRDMFGGFTMQADDPDPADTDEAAQPDAEQADTTDWVAEARKWEKRAKDNSAAAKRLATVEAELQKVTDADKTEAQKAADRATKAEQERDTLASELAALRMEQAVYRLAGTADPAALLDSRAFTAALDGLEPDDDKAITAAIKNAVKANPTLSRNRSGGDLHEGQQQHRRSPETAAPGVHRMAAAFDALLGNTP